MRDVQPELGVLQADAQPELGVLEDELDDVLKIELGEKLA